MEVNNVITSISVLHEIVGTNNPCHPLITWIKGEDIKLQSDQLGQSYLLGFYTIRLIDNRLMFSRPNQQMSAKDLIELNNSNGWIMCVHPEQVRGSEVEGMIRDIPFFKGSSNTNLILNKDEIQMINNLLNRISLEYEQNIDVYTSDLLLSKLTLLLHHCMRYYKRHTAV